VEDIEQSETLAKDLKTKHSQKQREVGIVYLFVELEVCEFWI